MCAVCRMCVRDIYIFFFAFYLSLVTFATDAAASASPVPWHCNVYTAFLVLLLSFGVDDADDLVCFQLVVQHFSLPTGICVLYLR